MRAAIFPIWPRLPLQWIAYRPPAPRTTRGRTQGNGRSGFASLSHIVHRLRGGGEFRVASRRGPFGSSSVLGLHAGSAGVHGGRARGRVVTPAGGALAGGRV